MNKLQQTLNFTLKMQVLIVFLFIKKEKKSTEKFFQKASRHKKKFLFAPAADICHALVFAAAPLYFLTSLLLLFTSLENGRVITGVGF